MMADDLERGEGTQQRERTIATGLVGLIENRSCRERRIGSYVKQDCRKSLFFYSRAVKSTSPTAVLLPRSALHSFERFNRRVGLAWPILTSREHCFTTRYSTVWARFRVHTQA